MLLLLAFLRFLDGLAAGLWYHWLPGQWVLSKHRPWGQGQLQSRRETEKNDIIAVVDMVYNHKTNDNGQEFCLV